MSIAHIGAWKLATLTLGALAAVVFTIDPSVKVLAGALLIASLPSTISGMFSVALQFMARKEQAEARKERAQLRKTMDEVKHQTDGINEQLRSDNRSKESDLKEANRKVDVAQGRQDERDDTKGH